MSLFDLDGIINAHNAAFTAECKNSTRLACELSTAKTELAAERQRREQAERLFEQRLLHQHDAELRDKWLVEVKESMELHDAEIIAPYIKIIEDAKEIIERYNDGDNRPAVEALSDIEAILWKP